MLKKEFLVSSADVDFEQKLRFSSLTNFLIQSAWQHAESLGWGVDELHKYNLVWVLSGLQIKLDQFPRWRETITIETWPKGMNRLFYLRDFHVYNPHMEVIGRASSSWLIIDMERRRPRLHNTESDVFQQNINKHAIEDPLPVLKWEGETFKSEINKVRFSDVDINHHLTTTRYIDWMFDTFSPGDISECRPKELIVNFNKEVGYGQQAFMNRANRSGNIEKFQLLSPENNRIYFNAELRY
jgi:acyl-ACP thioesterase